MLSFARRREPPDSSPHTGEKTKRGECVLALRPAHAGQFSRDVAPPLQHNLEAERSILGAILLHDSALKVAKLILTPADFFFEHHRKIYLSMLRLVEMSQPVDTVTLMADLERHGELENAGGVAYLSQLPDGLPRATNVEHYARVVREKSVLRDIVHCASAIQEQAHEAVESVDVILERAETALHQLRESANSTDWQKKFHRVAELPAGDVAFLIERILPEGVTFIGASSGVGKTWFALSMSRALVTGDKFLGVWNVPEPQNVLYLCPEMQSRPFKKRCTRLRIIGERFRCQTVSDGAPLNLANPALLAAVRDLHPVIILDTSIRFSNAESENSATDNQALARAIFALIHAGAKAVVCLHHRSKDAAKAEEMTLENVLRGTTDSGAIADAVYGLRYDSLGGHAPYLKESRKFVRLQVRCVKARDFCPVEDFRVQLDPFLDERGDMAVLIEQPEQRDSEGERLSQAIAANPKATKVELQATTGVGRNRVAKLAAAEGWHYDSASGWVKT